MYDNFLELTHKELDILVSNKSESLPPPKPHPLRSAYPKSEPSGATQRLARPQYPFSTAKISAKKYSTKLGAVRRTFRPISGTLRGLY